jgi:hypothetical protein
MDSYFKFQWDRIDWMMKTGRPSAEARLVPAEKDLYPFGGWVTV